MVADSLMQLERALAASSIEQAEEPSVVSAATATGSLSPGLEADAVADEGVASPQRMSDDSVETESGSDQDEAMAEADADAMLPSEAEEDDASMARARSVTVPCRPIGIKLRNARVLQDGTAAGAEVEAVHIKSSVLGRVGAGDEVVGLQRMKVSLMPQAGEAAAAAGGSAPEAEQEVVWEPDGEPLCLRRVEFEDIMAVMKELSVDLKQGKPCALLLD
jgi:hypothetical protein